MNQFLEKISNPNDYEMNNLIRENKVQNHFLKVLHHLIVKKKKKTKKKKDMINYIQI